MSLCTASPKLPLDSPLHEREEYQYSFSLRNPIPSHIAQAAFALFLHRTTGQDDIAFTKANQLVCSTLDETISLDAFSCSLKIAEGQNQIEFSDTTPPTAEFGLHLEEGLIHLYDYPKKHHPDTLHRWAQHIENIAQGMIQSPSSKAKTFSYITQEEENLVCDQWNQTKKEYPLDRLLYQRIEDQVLLTPNAEAVRFLERSMSYTELNAKANRLAHFLRQQGVKKETLVAVCMERSIELVIALLGILKAGGAYVPMDPSYPKERLKSILSDSKSPFLITQASLQTHFRHDLSMQICLDDLHFLDAFSSTNPESINTQKDLCYVIYTSGSTGKPKGVGNVYEGVVNRILWMQDTYRLLSSDRVVQKTPFGFDVSVWEFFWP
ncbi:MAG: AMP-binding protein, partial [Simkaniaceae bacterium]|nr:AMP-binding protein [Simkaniaceae bacterium]